MLNISYNGGAPPRFRLWAGAGQILNPRTIKIETVQANGVWRRFTMADREGYMESVEEIAEPITFTAYLTIRGETYAEDFS